MLNALSINKIAGVTHLQLVTTVNVSKWPKHSEHESDEAGSETKIHPKILHEGCYKEGRELWFPELQDFLSCQPNKNICKANSEN